MDTWGYFMWGFIIIGFSSISGILVKLKSVDRKLKALTGEAIDTVALKNMLLECIDRETEITFYEEYNIYVYSYVKVLDMDESWVLLEEVKNKGKLLVRIDSIKSIKKKVEAIETQK